MSDVTQISGEIKAFDPIERELATVLATYEGRVYNVATADGMATAKADLKEINGYLNRFDKLRKAVKEDALKTCKTIDSEAKRISGPVTQKIKEPLDRLIKDEEARLANIEAARKAAIAARVGALTRRPAWGATAADIRKMLAEVEATVIDEVFEDQQDDAVIAKAEAMRDLRAMAQQAEANEAAKEAAQVIHGASAAMGLPDLPAIPSIGLRARGVRDVLNDIRAIVKMGEWSPDMAEGDRQMVDEIGRLADEGSKLVLRGQ